MNTVRNFLCPSHTFIFRDIIFFSKLFYIKLEFALVIGKMSLKILKIISACTKPIDLKKIPSRETIPLKVSESEEKSMNLTQILMDASTW